MSIPGQPRLGIKCMYSVPIIIELKLNRLNRKATNYFTTEKKRDYWRCKSQPTMQIYVVVVLLSQVSMIADCGPQSLLPRQPNRASRLLPRIYDDYLADIED